MDINKPYPSGGSDSSGEVPQVPGSPRQDQDVRHSSGPGVVPRTESSQDATEEFQQQAGRAKERAKETKNRVKATASTVARQAAGKASVAGQRIKEFGSSAIDEQKRRAADEVGVVGSAIRKAGDKLHEEDDHNLGEYVEAAAEQVDRVERYLRERPVGTMYEDLQEFARRRPEMLVGGMFIAGVALARFLKASSPSTRRNSSQFDIYGQNRVAAGPLISPAGEPLTPNYPPPMAAEEHRIVLTETEVKTPEVK